MPALTDTIVAISSGHIAASAISVIRMAGSDSLTILKALWSKPQAVFVPRQMACGYITDPVTRQKIDQVLAVYFAQPHSYCGSDMVEIYGHGGLAVSEQIVSLCLGQGARLAGRGEFSQRAFLNGKMDLTQAEGVMDLIEADSPAAIQLAMQGLTGQLEKILTPLKKQLMDVMAHIEVNIDYPEYDNDISTITSQTIAPLIDQWLNQVDSLLQVSYSSCLIKDGIDTVIVGKPNVGKSSLLNVLLKQDKAIVTPVAGTTRDLVEGQIHLGDIKLHLIDTAGLHDSSDEIEQQGIAKSVAAMKQAQLVIVVLDGSQPEDEYDQRIMQQTAGLNRIVVYNKSDLAQVRHEMDICASAGRIEPLVSEIAKRFARHQIALRQPGLANQRQIGLLKQAQNEIIQAGKQLQEGISVDLIQDNLQTAYQCLNEIDGIGSDDDLMNAVFDRFCVGK